MTLLDEMRQRVRSFEANKPRSLQTAIGPSEIGSTCSRKLAYKLLNVEPVNVDSDPWAAIVGTSVHAYLDAAFKDHERWLTDVRVTLPGYMAGTLDLYDTQTRTIIDHKVVGKTSMDRFKREGVSDQYRTQVNVYALGMILAGHPVDNVAIVYWSRTGLLRDAQYWQEPYSETIAEDAMRKLEALRTITQAEGLKAITLLPAVESHCYFCPYNLPGVTELETACPGAAK
jgi:hypothetical protein